MINQPQTLTHLGHNQQQSFSELHQPGRSTNHKHWLTWVTTNSSPSQNCTNPAMINQPQTLTHLHGSQQTTVLLRTAPTRPWLTNHKHWLTWVTTNSSPSQNCTNPAIINHRFKPFTVLRIFCVFICKFKWQIGFQTFGISNEGYSYYTNIGCGGSLINRLVSRETTDWGKGKGVEEVCFISQRG